MRCIVFAAMGVLCAAPALAQPASPGISLDIAPAASQTTAAKAAAPHVISDGQSTAEKASYVPQTPPGQPKVSDAIAGKDGVKRLLVLRGLDKITGRVTNIYAPIGRPVKFATLTITARYCYSTPPSEPPETTAFIQITDDRPDKPQRKTFSGWMLASSPSLNGLQHPIYDVWLISCMTNQPGQQAPVVASTAPVKAVSPDAGSKEAIPELPAGSSQ